MMSFMGRQLQRQMQWEAELILRSPLLTDESYVAQQSCQEVRQFDLEQSECCGCSQRLDHARQNHSRRGLIGRQTTPAMSESRKNMEA